MSFKEEEDTYGFTTYNQIPIVFVRGKGTKLYDGQGKEYLDLLNGMGVSSIGHCHPAVSQAVKEQVGTLITCPLSVYNDKRAMLMKKLVGIAPANITKVFLCNSGTEAMEGAIKFARASTGRKGFISSQRGFHGRSFGALSATHQKKYQEPFEPLVPGFVKVKYNDFEDLQSKVTDDIAGIILEGVQGEGGIYVGDKEYFQKVRKLCDEKGILLILDEVQTGFGRTGKMFSFEHFDIVPDIMTCAKALGGGLPIGAILVDASKIKVPPKTHGTTFGGNPLCCVAALAALQVIEDEKLVAKAEQMGKYFVDKLKEIKSDKIREIRGLGLMIALDLKEKAVPYLKQLAEKGIFCTSVTPTALRLMPALNISQKEIDTVVKAIEDVLTAS